MSRAELGEGSPSNLPQIRQASLASPLGWRSGHPKISIPAKKTPPGIETCARFPRGFKAKCVTTVLAGLPLPTPTTIKLREFPCSESAANSLDSGTGPQAAPPPALTLVTQGQAGLQRICGKFVGGESSLPFTLARLLHPASGSQLSSPSLHPPPLPSTPIGWRPGSSTPPHPDTHLPPPPRWRRPG